MTLPAPPRRANHAPLDLDVIHSKCIEEGDCWLWHGAMKCGMPVVRHAGKVVNVRRYIAEHLQGLDVAGKLASCKCGDGMCCAPAHIDMIRRKQLQQRTTTRTLHQQRLVRKEKLAMAARARSPLDQAMVDAIRASELTGRQIAEQLGVAQSTVQHIRSHRSWKNYRSAFAGLM
jgi:hypothetical protein